MPSRVRLTWNRNQDIETEYYRIFRDEQPNIDHKQSKDKIVMTVDHPKTINPITIKNEILKRESATTYDIAHKNILIEHKGVPYPFRVTVDGVEVADYVLDRIDGKIILDNPVDESSIIKALEYTFDGMQIWDYDIEEEGKRYYGPEAKDTTPPTIPQNVTLDKDYENNRIIIRWMTSNPQGKVLYYRIDSAMDEQRFSKMSLMKSAVLREPLADRPYIVERSEDGKRWTEIAKVATNEYFEYSIDRKAPNPIRNLMGDILVTPGSGVGVVTLHWDQVFGDNSSTSSMYRIRSRNQINMISEPSEVVGPVELQTGLAHILIRRKVYLGTLPSYNGVDAETIAVLTDTTSTDFTEVLPDNTEYIYGIWVVDKAGNYSTIAYIRIDIGDATAPATPMNLSIDEFHIVAG